jgi:2-iminobutanoate/2-iminopropanoate deaminase
VADRVYNEFFKDGDPPACATVPVDWIPGGSHVEVTCIATTDLASRKVIRPAGLKVGPAEGAVTASPAVRAGHTLYLSGLSGIDPPGKAPADDVGEQVGLMAKSHTAVLEAAGLSLDDVVSGCVYLRDMNDYQPMNAVYSKFFSRGPGVRTCLMPAATSAKTPARVWASFIAAKTQ